MKRWFKRLTRPASKATKVPLPPIIDHRALGDVARGRRDWTQAGRHYAAHLGADPADFGIWIQLGHMLKEQGLLNEAEAAYCKASDLDDQNADLWLNRGHLAKLRSQNLTAREFYTRSYAIDKNPRALTELLSLGVAESELQHDPAAGESQQADAQVASRVVGSIDVFDGTSLLGWAADPDQPESPAEVEVLRNGVVIAQGRGSFARGDIRSLGPEENFAGFSIPLGDTAMVGDVLSVRLKRTRETLANSPFTLEQSLAARRWLARHEGLTPDEIMAIKAQFARETAGLKLSIVMPVSEGPLEQVRQAVGSVVNQWCPHWELLCIISGDSGPSVRDFLNAQAAADPRLKVLVPTHASGRPVALSTGIEASSGDYIAIMSAQAVLEPEAVFRCLDAGLSGAGVIYTDEITTRRDLDDLHRFILRPAFSYDLYLSNPDFGQFVCYRANLARSSLRQGSLEGAAIDVDLALRILEGAETVVHVPAVLYRTRPANTDGDEALALRGEAVLGSLNSHLQRTASQGVARPGFRPGNYTMDYPDDQGRTLIIIPTRDRIDLLEPCLEAIWRTTDMKHVDIVVIDHESAEKETKQYLRKIRKRITVVPFKGQFNYARMNNQVVDQFGSAYKYIVFMNNDIEAIAEGWLERMRSIASRSDVGIVGATLIYGDNRIQHAGVIAGVAGPVTHAHKFTPLEVDGVRTPGPNASLISTRDYVAVTGACTLMRSEVFRGVGGFDDSLLIDFNDIDLCLRIGSLGYRILNDARSVLYHHESATRKKGDRVVHSAETAIFIRRWHELLAMGDPFYNPLLSLVAEHDVGHIVDVYHPVRVRGVNATLQPLAVGQARRVPGPIRYP